MRCNKERRNRIICFALKVFAVIFLFAGTLALAWLFKLPTLFDSHVAIDNDYLWYAHVFLILYRAIIYFVFPPLITVFERMWRKEKYLILLLENFNVQFFTYSLVSGLYLLLGLDKHIGAPIFSSADTLMFLASFVFTLVLGKGINKMPNKNKSEENNSNQL